MKELNKVLQKHLIANQVVLSTSLKVKSNRTVVGYPKLLTVTEGSTVFYYSFQTDDYDTPIYLEKSNVNNLDNTSTKVSNPLNL